MMDYIYLLVYHILITVFTMVCVWHIYGDNKFFNSLNIRIFKTSAIVFLIGAGVALFDFLSSAIWG